MADPDKVPEDGGQAETPAAAPQGGLKGLFGGRFVLPILGAVLAAAMGFVFACVVFPPETAVSTEAEPDDPDEQPDLASFAPPEMIDLPRCQITLADTDKEGHARLDLMFQFRARAPQTVNAKLRPDADMHVVIKDALITHISGKTTKDLKGIQGKEILKLELLDLLNSILFPDPTEGRVTAIYFEDILVQ